MARSYDFYERIARKYDEMYESITWNVHHEIIRNILDEIVSGSMHIMDLGAGTGRWALYFAKKGMEVTAVEPSGAMIEVMKEKVNSMKIKFVQSKAENMNFFQEFDLINAQGDVLSYLDDLEEGLNRIHKALKPNGIFTGTVDSKYFFIKDLSRMGEFEKIDAIERNPVIFIGDPDVDITFKTRLFTSKTLSQLLEDHKFKVIEISGIITFGPYEESLHSKFNEIVENELRYKDDPILVDQAMHLHFKAKKIEEVIK
ncbi:class I SAM-dependent methyltransferase [Athalassotoga saccharophila]|uniref:class I SAM-dependent methyltransferase n=1 Tax=Athalassotoga saccharophila TaxID=1441386 RepID=UPI00137AC485|nr:class I SAM-dependent methyltransferase [Athalassotoga saccharophila]